LAVGLGGIALFAWAQTSGSGAALLKSFGAALAKAEAVQTTYSITALGGASKDVTLALAKPNKVRIESASELAVADGETITIFDKGAKTYFKRKQSDAELRSLMSTETTQLWSAFFDDKAFDNGYTAKALPDKVRKGVKFKVVEVTPKDAADVKWTLYIDPADSIAKQAEVSVGSTDPQTKVFDVKNFEMKAGADLFAFKAPDGSKEVKEEDMISDRWYTSLAEGKEVAKKTKRILLVDFYADW